MPVIALSDEIAALQIVASLEELLRADAVWTRFLSSASKIRSQDRQPILDLAKRMDKLLAALPASTLVLQQTAKRIAKISPSDFEEFLKSLPVDDQRQAEKLVQTEGGFAAVLRAYATSIRKGVESERKLLGSKRKLIAAGKFTPGDLSQGFICDVCKLLIVLSILTGNEWAFHFAVAQAKASDC